MPPMADYTSLDTFSPLNFVLGNGMPFVTKHNLQSGVVTPMERRVHPQFCVLNSTPR